EQHKCGECSMMTDLVARLRAPSVTNRPPKPSEIRRNDLAVLVTVVVALLFGLTVREQARSLHRTWRLGSGLPAVWYPAGWITAQPDPAQQRQHPRAVQAAAGGPHLGDPAAREAQGHRQQGEG
ncbi:MAG TPA: hypothetical protein PKE45_19900, partial [Caldilineaceae bacterium]|nr:hypothetical protein [Caldilineaceae bacterium]